jgi:hypothetical protein
MSGKPLREEEIQPYKMMIWEDRETSSFTRDF